MKTPAILVLLLSSACFAAAQQQQKRDAAIKQINACSQARKALSRECRNVDQSVAVLMDLYKSGDKTVLPVLFRFPQLTEFYGDAFLADPEAFITAMSRLPEKDQPLVAVGLAGEMFGIPAKERFDRIRSALLGIPASAPIHPAAELCLKRLERENIGFLVDYFPPQTFSGRAADFQVHSFSRVMYALGERPLWADSQKTNGITYRLTVFSSFGAPTAITLTLKPGADPQLETTRLGSDGRAARIDAPATISPEAISSFLADIDGAQFWDSPTEMPPPKAVYRMDGAEWMIEGLKDGNYHVAVRWCPAFERLSPEEIRFGEAGLLLFQIAGLKRSGSC